MGGKKQTGSGYVPPEDPVAEYTLIDGPISIYGDEVEILYFQMPRGKHMKALRKVENDTDRAFGLIAKLALIPVAALDEMTTRDINGCNKALAPFLSSGDED